MLYSNYIFCIDSKYEPYDSLWYASVQQSDSVFIMQQDSGSKENNVGTVPSSSNMGSPQSDALSGVLLDICLKKHFEK